MTYKNRPDSEELHRLYVEDRMTTVQIGEMLNVTKTTISNWLHLYGIDVRTGSDKYPVKPRPKHKNRPTDEELRRLYIEESMSIPQLSAMFGCSISSAHRWLESANIERRSAAETRLKGIRRLTPDELYQMYVVDMMDTVEIAKEHGVGATTIGRWLESADIKMRSISEAHLKGKQKPSDECLHQMYIDEGMTTTAIGDAFGIDPRTIWRWLMVGGTTPRPVSEMHLFGKHKPTRDELYKLYTLDNLSTREIGAIVDVDSATIRRWLRDYDIPVRSVSDALMGKWVGEKSPSWRGGKSRYCHKFNETFKESMREEFGRKCFICGKSEHDNGKKLAVHHTNYDRSCMCENVECRFVPLCTRCHGRTNFNRFYWYSLIMRKLLLQSSSEFVILELNI